MIIYGGTKYFTFGGAPWSYVTDREGNAVPNQELDILDPTDFRILNLRDKDGFRINTVTSDEDGMIPTFLAPVKSLKYRWFDANFEDDAIWHEQCREVIEITPRTEAAALSASNASGYAAEADADRIDAEAIPAQIPPLVDECEDLLLSIPLNPRTVRNSLDGADTVAVTTVNSADHGDAFDTVSGTVTYDADAYEGTGAAYFANTGTNVLEWDYEANISDGSASVVFKISSASSDAWVKLELVGGGYLLVDPFFEISLNGGVTVHNHNDEIVEILDVSNAELVDEWIKLQLNVSKTEVRGRVWLNPTDTLPHDDVTVSQSSSFTAISNAKLTALDSLCDFFYTLPGLVNHVERLSSPLYVAHRGGANLAPENTLEALDLCRSRGVQAVEIDVAMTKDRQMFLMHDSTIDDNTTQFGEVGHQSSMSVKRLKIDAGNWFGNRWPNDLHVPDLLSVLKEYKNDLTFFVEIKADAGSEAGQVTVDTILEAGAEHRCVVISFTRDQLDPALAAGIATGWLVSDGDEDHAQVASDGIRFFIVNGNIATTTVINDAITAGLDTMCYTINRHVDRDALLASHPTLYGLVSDDPWYLDPNFDHVMQERPLFMDGTFGDGHSELDPSFAWTEPGRGDFQNVTGPGVTGLTIDSSDDPTTPNNGYKSVTVGGVSPVPDPSGSYNLTFYLQNVIIGGASSLHGHIIFCAESDEGFNDNDHNVECYVAMLRQNDSADLYYQDGVGGFSNIGTATWGDNDGWIRIEVTPTQIKFIRTNSEDGTALDTITASNTAVRGAYVQLGVRDARARFAKLTYREV